MFRELFGWHIAIAKSLVLLRRWYPVIPAEAGMQVTRSRASGNLSFLDSRVHGKILDSRVRGNDGR